MQIIRTVAEFHAARRRVPSGKTLGLVPTMGGLHAGHLSLVRRAKATCDLVAVSVFVNPTQFGPTEDFAKYPRTFEHDMALLETEGVDYAFVPRDDEMYSKLQCCFVVPEGFNELPEGKCRPVHFRGVATVVTKLFHIVSPTHAFFGQKDAAQCVLIKRLVADLNMDIQLTIVPVYREEDGLALSTRNQYLSPEERKAACVLFRGLSKAKQYFEALNADAVKAEEIRAIIKAEYDTEPLMKQLDYISIGSTENMKEVAEVTKADGAIISVAAKFGNCRLIDTMTL